MSETVAMTSPLNAISSTSSSLTDDVSVSATPIESSSAAAAVFPSPAAKPDLNDAVSTNDRASPNLHIDTMNTTYPSSKDFISEAPIPSAAVSSIAAADEEEPAVNATIESPPRASSTSPSLAASMQSSTTPPPPPRPDRVIEFVALYSYDTAPFVRTSHPQGPSGFDYISGNSLKGKMEYRVPTTNAPEVDVDLESLAAFVYPQGLRLEIAPQQPTLHSFVLTMVSGRRMYAYCYTRWVPVPDHVLTVVKMQIGEDLIDCDDPNPQHLPSQLYGPHSLVFISAFPFYDNLTTMLKYMGERFFMRHIPHSNYHGQVSHTPTPHPALPASMSLVDAIYAAYKDVIPLRVPLGSIETRAAEMCPQAMEFRDAVTNLCAHYSNEILVPDDILQLSVFEIETYETNKLAGQSPPASANASNNTSPQHPQQQPRMSTSTPPPTMDLQPLIKLALDQCLMNLCFLLPAAPFENVPLIEASMLGVLFDSLDLSHIISVWNAVLCELPCLFVSADVAKLTPALEAISALLYPMKWPYVYIPVLPIFLIDVLDAPQSILVGAHRAVLDCLPDALKSGETNVVIVDLDNNFICMSASYEYVVAKRAAAANGVQPTTTRKSIIAAIAGSSNDSSGLPDAPPIHDPFLPNSRMINCLLNSQGIMEENNTSTTGLLFDKLLAHNPVTFLGEHLLDNMNLAPAPLSFKDLNPFASSKQSFSTSSSSNPNANTSPPQSIDGECGTRGLSNENDDEYLDEGAAQPIADRHRFLPWNLVWRLHDGVGAILNPLIAQQKEEEAERRNARSLLSEDDLPLTLRSLSSAARASAASPTGLVLASNDLSTAPGGRELLSSLPPNLPTHAWPVMLPGLVRELRASLTSSSMNNVKRSLDLDLHDPSIGLALTYLGNEQLFLNRFQAVLEKSRKPLLLLTTTRYMYSGTDVSASESELGDEPSSSHTHSTTHHSHTGSATAAAAALPKSDAKKGDSDDEDPSLLVRQVSVDSSISSPTNGVSAVLSPTSSNQHHHHLLAAPSSADDAPPQLLHMTSTPEMLPSATDNVVVVSHGATLATPAAKISFARSNSTFVHSSASPSPGDMTTPLGVRLTPMTSEDEGDDGDDEDADERDDAPSDLKSPTGAAGSKMRSKRASEPSLGFQRDGGSSSGGKFLSPFRQKQASLSKLAPPKLTGGDAGNRNGSDDSEREQADNVNNPSFEESESLTPLTPSTPAVFSTGSPVMPSSVPNSRASLSAPAPQHGSRRSSLSIRAQLAKRASIAEDETQAVEEMNVEDMTDFDAMPARSRQRESVNESDLPRPAVSSTSPPLPVGEGSLESITETEVSLTIAVHVATRNSVSSAAAASAANRPAPAVVPDLPLRELASSNPRDSFWPGMPQADVLVIRRKFLGVLVSLLHSHKAFTGFEKKDFGGGGSAFAEEDNYEVTFENASYLRYVHKDYRAFLTLFLSTQMFKFFIEERLTRDNTTNSSFTSVPPTPSGVPVSTTAAPSTGPSSVVTIPSTPTATAAASAASSTNSTSTSVAASAPAWNSALDWFDRLCAQKRNRTRFVFNAWGENGKSGLLHKLGRKVPTWKERYFELNRHGTILRYYAYSEKMIELEPQWRDLKRKHKLQPKDVVTKANLDRIAASREKLRASLYRGEITLIPGQTSVLIPNQSRKYMTCYCFEVVTPTRSLLACAPDLVTRDEWILCIRARAAKLSIEHKRAGTSRGLGSVPHLESRLQMQLRLLREKNIASLTKSFMDNLHRRQQKIESGDTSTDAATAAEERKKQKAAAAATLPTSASTLNQPEPLSLPHALLVCEHLRTSLDLRKFSTLFKTHNHCFSGRDATHYILHQSLCDRLSNAIALCNTMLKNGLILNVNHSAKEPFQSDPKYMYTFPKESLLNGSGIGSSESDASSVSNLLPTEEERVIVSRMREELDIRDRTPGLFRSVVKSCFVAKDAIAWLLDRGICTNESAAIRLATRLVRTSQMMPANNECTPATHEFENNGDLYRFHAAIRPMNSSHSLFSEDSFGNNSKRSGKK